MLARHEHDHEIGGLAELPPVFLATKLVRMGFQRLGVGDQVCVARTLVRRLGSIEERHQRGLGVHDQLTPARQVDDRVRPQRAVFARIHMHFRLEIDVSRQARHLQHVAQLLLAPAAPRLRARLERMDQFLRLRAQLTLIVQHGLDLLLEAAVGLHPRLLDIAHALFVAGERVLHRGQQRFQLGAGLGEVRRRALAVALHRLLGHAQELLLVLAQRRVGERLEILLQLAAHFGQLGNLGRNRLLALCRLRLDGRQPGLQGLALGALMAQRIPRRVQLRQQALGPLIRRPRARLRFGQLHLHGSNRLDHAVLFGPHFRQLGPQRLALLAQPRLIGAQHLALSEQGIPFAAHGIPLAPRRVPLRREQRRRTAPQQPTGHRTQCHSNEQPYDRFQEHTPNICDMIGCRKAPKTNFMVVYR